MIITFQEISTIFSEFIKSSEKEVLYEGEIQKLIHLLIKTNKTLWDLEDSARLSELGDSHVASAKKNIDISNQYRNNLIREIDTFFHSSMNIVTGSVELFYSESPGMILDRLSIIFIKHSVVQKIISVIQEDDLKGEYRDKSQILSYQIESIGDFFDRYMDRLIRREVFFEIQQPVKIYNDLRIRKYLN